MAATPAPAAAPRAPARRPRRARRGPPTRRPTRPSLYTKLPAAFFRRFLEAPAARKTEKSSTAPLRAFIGPVREPRDHDKRYYYRHPTAGPASR